MTTTERLLKNELYHVGFATNEVMGALYGGVRDAIHNGYTLEEIQAAVAVCVTRILEGEARVYSMFLTEV